MFVGIDVRDTKIGMGLVSDKGELSFQSTFPIDSEQDFDKVTLDIIFVVKSISETVPLELFNDNISGIGICTQHTLDKNSAMQVIIQGYFDVPVFVENIAVDMVLADNEINNAGIIAAGLLCIGRV